MFKYEYACQCAYAFTTCRWLTIDILHMKIMNFVLHTCIFYYVKHYIPFLIMQMYWWSAYCGEN